MAKYCMKCGAEMIKDGKTWWCYNCIGEDDEDDFDEDEGCIACGNPAYPDCMDSCPIYDD